MGNYYFASDVHLGLNYGAKEPQQREREFVDWLRSIADDCSKLFLVGDIFDFWFEWRNVIPQGFTRLFGQLAAMSDSGIEIHFFAGNHDLWIRDYFTRELGVIVHMQSAEFEVAGIRFFVAHGDTQGQGMIPDDVWGRRLSRLFRNTFARWSFSNLLHPDIAMDFGMAWSNSSRHGRGALAHEFGGNNERIVVFAKDYLRFHPQIKYFICGHFHTPLMYDLILDRVEVPLSGGGRDDCDNRGSDGRDGRAEDVSGHSLLCILGEWVENPHYARLDTLTGQLSLISIGK